MQEDLISVIVPIYNVEPYLDRCVGSLVRQTYDNLEILLVDDGSTDNSGVLAEDWGRKDSRITVYHKKNGGLSDARNYGIDRAKGRYLSFVDSDDFVDEAFFQVLYDMLICAEAQMSVVGFLRFADENTLVPGGSRDREVQVYSTREAMAKHFDRRFSVNAWNKLYDRSLFAEIRFPPCTIAEDLATTYRLIDKSRRVAFCPVPLYYYFQRADSIMHRRGAAEERETYGIFLTRYRYLKENYPELAVNDRAFFDEIFETFPFLSPQARAEALAEAAAIWGGIEQEASLKTRLKYLAIRHTPGLYAWNKRRKNEKNKKKLL